MFPGHGSAPILADPEGIFFGFRSASGTRECIRVRISVSASKSSGVATWENGWEKDPKNVDTLLFVDIVVGVPCTTYYVTYLFTYLF